MQTHDPAEPPTGPEAVIVIGIYERTLRPLLSSGSLVERTVTEVRQMLS